MSEVGALEPKASSGVRLLIRFWFEYAHRHKWTYALGAFFLLATTGLGTLIPKLVQWSVESLEAKESVVQWAVALLGAGLATIIVRTLSRTLIFNPGREVEYDLKKNLFDHLLKLPARYYEQELSAGEIINRGTNDAAAVRGLIGYGSLQLLNVSMTLLLTLSQMVWIDLKLTLYCLPPLIIAALILRKIVLIMFSLTRESLSQVGALGDQLLEAYGGASLVQNFGAQKGVQARFDADNLYLLKLIERLQAIFVWGLPVVTVMGQLCIVILLAIGGAAVARGTLSLGALTAMIVYINLLVGCITSLGWLTGAIQRGYLSLVRLYEVLDAPLVTPSNPQQVPQGALEGHHLKVEGLTFCYPTAQKPTLIDLSFELNPGEIVGIFGLTGSGKSTLLDVLSRTYDPPQNVVWINGVDLTQIESREYWRHVTYVQQQAFMFSDRLRDNITLGMQAVEDDLDEQNLNEKRLVDAIEAACLSAEIEHFSHGLDTQVGERGVTLSGGQRQRSALARAFYRTGYQLLLLDDVLSAVDHATELKLIESIYARQPACTTLIVSHRMSVLQRADRILVIDEGRLVAQGTPEELSKQEGIYADAWHAQQVRGLSEGDDLIAKEARA